MLVRVEFGSRGFPDGLMAEDPEIDRLFGRMIFCQIAVGNTSVCFRSDSMACQSVLQGI